MVCRFQTTILVGIYNQQIQGTLIYNGLIPIKCNLPRIMAWGLQGVWFNQQFLKVCEWFFRESWGGKLMNFDEGVVKQKIKNHKVSTKKLNSNPRYPAKYIHLEPKWPLFLQVNPPKQGLFQSKQGSVGFQANTLFRHDIKIFTPGHPMGPTETWSKPSSGGRSTPAIPSHFSSICVLPGMPVRYPQLEKPGVVVGGEDLEDPETEKYG